MIQDSVFATPGTYTWTCPEGVTSVSALAVGGGSGGLGTGSGGAGGGLGWKNNIAVTPGQTYTVVVGAGGLNGGVNTMLGSQFGPETTKGGDSYFINTSTVAGFGGGRPYYSNTQTIGNDSTRTIGGSYVGDGGGNGGRGGRSWDNTTQTFQGGGGAGGYTGNGGDGAEGGGNGIGFAGTGGGGGGGFHALVGKGSNSGEPNILPGGGGGVGIYGQGANGYAPEYNYTQPTPNQDGAYGGGGGSGGANGNNGLRGNHSVGISDTKSKGGAFGGGAGGGGYEIHAGGAGGAVRIIWGDGASFPSNAAFTSTQTLTTTTATIVEGQSFTVNLTSSAPNGSVFAYQITGVTSSDLNGASLTGNFTVNAGTASVTFSTTASFDLVSRADKTFTITLTGSNPVVSTNVLIVDATPADDITFLRMDPFKDTVDPSLLSNMIFVVPYDESAIMQAFPSNGFFRFGISVDGLTDPSSVTPGLAIRWYTI